MFLPILRLLLKTRFTRGYFVFLFTIAFIYSILILDTGQPGYFSVTSTQILFVVFLYFMILSLSLIFGNGLSLTKPDQDFLLPSSTHGNSMAYALFSAQFLSFGLMFIVLSIGYSVLYGFNPVYISIVLLDFAMLGGSLTSLSVSTADLKIQYRLLVFLASSVFLLSFLIGFKYSPFSVVTGSLAGGTVGTLLFFLVPFYFAIRWMRKEPLTARTPAITLNRKENYKDVLEFSGLSPRGAVFRNYFFHAYIANTVNGLGQSLARTRRIRLLTAVKVMTVLAVIIAAGIYILSTYIGVNGVLVILFIFTIYLAIYPQLILFSSTFSVERIWLSGLAFPFSTYVQTMVFAQMMQCLVLDIPMAIAFSVLGLFLSPAFFAVVYVQIILAPISVGVLSSLSVIARPPQVQEGYATPNRMGARRMLYVMPYTAIIMLGTVFAILYLPLFFIPLGLGTSIILYLLIPAKRWDNMLSKLVEKNYI